MLGIPFLDGRKTHLGPVPGSVRTDGRTLTAEFGAPFEGVRLAMRVLDGGRVELVYDKLPADLKMVMTQFTLTQEMADAGVSVSFDGWKTVKIPAEPGRTNEEVRLLDINASRAELRWADGAVLALTVPGKCWFGIQDQRVWGKNSIGVCLTPALKRDAAGGETATLLFTFTTGRDND